MSKKVIIIDDNLISLNIIKTAFAHDGWETYGVQQAKQAIEMLYDIAPDLIVTDAIMPVMGGFQLLKILRGDAKTEKIPVIVYSVLDEKNSKFYIKKERAEYYLKKSDNIIELLTLATYVVKSHPLDDEYKYELLKKNLEISNLLDDKKNIKPVEKQPIDKIKLEAEFKQNYDFTKSDDKILSNIFSLIYPILNYNLCVVAVESFEKREKTAYFDIKDIILSPIVQNNILLELGAKNSFLLKKYAPNLKVITNEEELFTKIAFNFENEEKNIGNVIFYSKDKAKWFEDDDIEIIKNLLDNFFKARYINKSAFSPKINDLSSKYFIDKLDFKFDSGNKKETYCAIIEISNYKELQDGLQGDELDYVNSRISEKLISFLSDDEQVTKNSDDEYNIVFFAKDRVHAAQKLEWIEDILSEIEIDNYKIEVRIGASDCKIDGQFNFYEAQKLAVSALDETNNQNRIVIYGTK